ncbi:MAG: hypothetical protein AAF456_15275 [Planctomycetota bacterium]
MRNLIILFFFSWLAPVTFAGAEGQLIPTTQLLPAVDFAAHGISRGLSVDVSSRYVVSGVPDVFHACGPVQ